MVRSEGVPILKVNTVLYILRNNFSSFPHYFIYIFLISGVKLHISFVKCGCSIYCFPHSLNSDMSRYGYLEVFQ